MTTREELTQTLRCNLPSEDRCGFCSKPVILRAIIISSKVIMGEDKDALSRFLNFEILSWSSHKVHPNEAIFLYGANVFACGDCMDKQINSAKELYAPGSTSGG